MSMTFAELLDSMPEAGTVVPVTVKSLGGKQVFFRQPSSRDADAWRVYCGDKSSGPRAVSARLVQMLLCDESGQLVIPQDEDALEELASRTPQIIDEIAKAIFPFVKEPTDDELREVAGN